MERLTWDDIEALADANWHRRDAQGTMLDKVRAQFHAYTVELADAQATVEALQRERNEAQALVSERASMIGSLTAALDAEREKVKCGQVMIAGENERAQIVYKHYRSAMDELRLLKVLVRALCNSGDRLLDDVIGTSDAADSLKHHIRQVRATLDTTTLAARKE